MASEVEILSESKNKNFATRLWELPLAMAAVEQVSTIYSSAKERNAVTRIACNAGESTFKIANAATNFIKEVASSYSLSKAIVGRVESVGESV